MGLISNENMPLREPACGDIATPRTVDDFVDTIRHLQLRLKVTETICGTIEVERLAELLKAGPLNTEVGRQNAESVALEEGATSILPIRDEKCTTDKRAECGPKENVIAASISDLYDRLGGFIKA